MTQQDILTSDRQAAVEEWEGKSHSFKARAGAAEAHV